MTNPVPSHPAITTAYGIRSSWWSCRKDSAGNGIHTGVDFGSGGISGATAVASRDGTARFVNYGSAFGSHQLAIQCADGSEDFYAHMSTRLVSDGQKVNAGEPVGKVGQEGNVSGPHLHFERHTTHGVWSCDIVTNPQPSIDYEGEDEVKPEDIEKIAQEVASRVNGILGDYDNKGKKRDGQEGDRGDTRLRQVEQVVRKIAKKVGA
jgi:murein DD-endopeptidase MepM/ murein hydrolase activator NlpD